MGIIDIYIGGLEPCYFMTFHIIGNVIFPTEELIIFQRAKVGQPPPLRARDLFFGLWVPDLFMKRALEKTRRAKPGSNWKTPRFFCETKDAIGEMNLDPPSTHKNTAF